VARYVAKVIFTYILGYKVDVGHMEAVNLISSMKYSEKQIVSVVNTVSRRY
jgi:AP-2 complex subunit alpha